MMLLLLLSTRIQTASVHLRGWLLGSRNGGGYQRKQANRRNRNRRQETDDSSTDLYFDIGPPSTLFRRLSILFIAMAISILALVVFVLLQLHSFSEAGPNAPGGSVQKSSNKICPDSPTCDRQFNLRLSTQIRPRHYFLTIHPNISTLTFTGTVRIELETDADGGSPDDSFSLDRIILHSKDLTVTEDSYKLTLGSSSPAAAEKDQVAIKTVLNCTRHDQLSFELAQPLQLKRKGANLTLQLSFSGEIKNNFAGLYSSIQKHPGGKSITSLITQFESTDARRMFPCFDEPAFKAVFHVKLIHETENIGLGNGPLLKSTAVSDGVVMDEFGATPVMSTYLVAVGVLQNFERISSIAQTVSSLNVSVLAPKDLISDAQFALEIAVSSIEWLEKFFLIEFPLPKQDIVAVSDFAAGAMENWGLITFRDYILLYNPETSTAKSQETVATVVCHELAHQWFGNLVTMKWWNDLWLNEGFASFIEYFGISKVKPEWNVMDVFYSETVIYAMYLDGLHTSHPISVDVKDPAEIGSIFDAISYQKGSSLIQMFMDIAGGEAVFQRGLQKYLKRYQFSNAEGKDLWQCLGEEIGDLDGNNLPDVAEKWTSYTGYPVVRLKIVPTPSSNNKNSSSTLLHLEQTRFTYIPVTNHSSESVKKIWPLSISYKTNKGGGKRFWFTTESAEQEIAGGPFSWIMINLDAKGYYRVQYAPKMFRAISKQLHANPDVFEPAERASILYDGFSLLKSGDYSSMSDVLDAVTYIKGGKELEKTPLSITISQLKQLESIMWDTDDRPLFRKFLIWLYEDLYVKSGGWKLVKGHLDRQRQIMIISLMCSLRYKPCLKQAMQHFQMYMGDPNSIEVDLKPLVVSLGVQEGDEEVWNSVYNLFATSKKPYERNYLLMSLGSTKDPWLLEKLLRMSQDRRIVKPGLMSRVIEKVGGNEVGGPLAWRFLRMNYETIDKKLRGTTMLGKAIRGCIQSFSSKFDHDEAKNFLKGREFGSSENMVKQAFESIELNIQIKRLHRGSIHSWLQSWSSAAKNSKNNSSPSNHGT